MDSAGTPLPPSGHGFRVERQRGSVWYAKFRLSDGRQAGLDRPRSASRRLHDEAPGRGVARRCAGAGAPGRAARAGADRGHGRRRGGVVVALRRARPGVQAVDADGLPPHGRSANARPRLASAGGHNPEADLALEGHADRLQSELLEVSRDPAWDLPQGDEGFGVCPVIRSRRSSVRAFAYRMTSTRSRPRKFGRSSVPPPPSRTARCIRRPRSPGNGWASCSHWNGVTSITPATPSG